MLQKKNIFRWDQHCIKIVRIRRFCGPYFPVFELYTENTEYTEYLSVFSPNAENIRTRKTPNTDTFHVVQKFCEFQPSLVYKKILRDVTTVL